MKAGGRGLVGGLALPALIVLLPFEPLSPRVTCLGAELSLLELAAALVLATLLGEVWKGKERLSPLPAPLVLLGLFVVVNALSAALAEAHPTLARRFVLKVAAAWLLAAIVAVLPEETRRRSLVALVATTSLVAVLSILEGLGLRSLDPFLGLFRERPFLAGGVRRATAGSWNPNQAAAFMSSGLLAAVALALDRERERALALVTALLATGLLFTYSRGAFVATVVALASLALALARRGISRGLARVPATTVGVLLGATLVFAATRPSLWLRVTVESAGLRYGARYVLPVGHLSVRPGAEVAAAVSVLNTGNVAWTAQRFGIAARWYDLEERAESEGPMARVARTIPPGERLETVLPVVAPDREGRYALVLDVFERGRGLFSTYGTPPAVLPVSVSREGSPPPFTFDPPADVWRRGRFELWRIAALLWRDHPLLGVGPDNYRWLHAARGGWLVVGDFTRSADSTYLEIAATTGTLGLIAYLATLAAAGRRAWRGLQVSCVPSAAAFGILVAMAVHGSVEYLLRFSGHSLLFGLVVGLACGVREDSAAAAGASLS